MIVWYVMMFVAAAVFAVFATLITKGNASLINCYREERVKDKATYCKKFGQSLFIMAATMLISGVISLFSDAETVILIALGVLIAGVLIGIVRLFHVQKKYGGGIF
ncbi:MAG: DUF3784 domain-containing protein [Oscillospiraceae bacterium]|nr:DUF3784 domain-containing protein [Bacteroidaceae bacterium]MBQ3191499.1 DUF3784 domain-containing protein [Bacteroides sp.]MBQ3542050.1 DUF3784 domain-containing protein [Oscillospiraceae bacterium]